MQRGFGPRKCPGLTVNSSGAIWVDSLGRAHDLLAEPRLTPGEAALRMKRSSEWVLRKIRANELYPHVYYNPRLVELWSCAIDDYLVRTMRKGEDAAA